MILHHINPILFPTVNLLSQQYSLGNENITGPSQTVKRGS